MADETGIVIQTDVPVETPRVTGTDDQLVELWLHGLSPHTQRAYRTDSTEFRRHAVRPLRAVGLADVQAFARNLETLRRSTG